MFFTEFCRGASADCGQNIRHGEVCEFAFGTKTADERQNIVWVSLEFRLPRPVYRSLIQDFGLICYCIPVEPLLLNKIDRTNRLPTLETKIILVYAIRFIIVTVPNYCSHCGTELNTKQIEGRERAYCTHCEKPVYRNAKPCAGTIVVDDSEVLLVERTNPPAVGSWSLPAGFLELEEPPAKAAARELTEETGLFVSTDELRLCDTNLVSHPDDTHVLVIIYQTTRVATTGTVTASSDAADARFWKIDELLECGESIETGYESILRKAISRN